MLCIVPYMNTHTGSPTKKVRAHHVTVHSLDLSETNPARLPLNLEIAHEHDSVFVHVGQGLCIRDSLSMMRPMRHRLTLNAADPHSSFFSLTVVARREASSSRARPYKAC